MHDDEQNDDASNAPRDAEEALAVFNTRQNDYAYIRIVQPPRPVYRVTFTFAVLVTESDSSSE